MHVAKAISSIFYTTYTQHGQEFPVFGTVQSLGEDVSGVVWSGNILEGDIFWLISVLYIVVFDVDVFCACMENRILYERYDTHVVTLYKGWSALGMTSEW